MIIFSNDCHSYSYSLLIFFIINVISIVIFIFSNEAYCFRRGGFSLMNAIIHVLLDSLVFIANFFFYSAILLRFTSSFLIIRQILAFQSFLLATHLRWISFLQGFCICFRLRHCKGCLLYMPLIQVYQFNCHFQLIFVDQLKKP